MSQSLRHAATFFHGTPTLYRIVVLISLLVHVSSAASLEEWRTRTIYQILTDRYSLANGSTTQPCNVNAGLYCGGSWKGIQNRLDYIQGMNFDAIWISPIVGQLPQETGDGEAYTAYWQQDLYALNSNFGSADDLHDLITDVHARGMYLMLDIVVNHFGYSGSPDSIDFSVFNPFNESSYFHTYCPIDDFANQTNVEVCWLGDETVPLVDLRTEDTTVQSMYAEWIEDLVQTYAVDGLRIDSSINVNYTFFPDFVNAAGVFATGEVMTSDESLACNWAGPIGSILNYPMYYTLVDAFADSTGSIGDLTEMMSEIQANCPNPTALGLFSESHDVPRFANKTNDMALAQNVITYTIMGDGIPIIYQGQEQHMNGGITPYYTNRAPLWQAGYNQDAPLYELITTLVQARQHMLNASAGYATSNSEVIYQDYHTFAMRKGVDGSQALTVLTNDGAGADDWVLNLHRHGLSSGTFVTDVLSCEFFIVNGTGFLNLPMGRGQAKVLIPSNLIPESRLCGFAESEIATATVIADAYETTIKGHPTVITSVTTESVAIAAQTPSTTASTASTVDSAPAASSSNSSSRVGRSSASTLVLAACCWATVFSFT